MKPILYPLLAVLFAACTTTETFDEKGRVTSRTKSPSPETWTAVSDAVAAFGSVAVGAWVDQIANQQRWEKGLK